MNDRAQLERLIRLGHPCISISTFEEDYVLELLRDVAITLKRPLWLWSIAGGVQDGIVTGSVVTADSDKPAAGLMQFVDIQGDPLCVTLDLVPHLQDERTLRVLRTVLQRFAQCHSQLVLIDYRADLPDLVGAYATPFRVSLPDEVEIEQLVRDTLRHANQRKPIVIDTTKAGLRTVVRNLRGLSRRQITQIIADTVSQDRRFDADDLHVVLQEKRRALHRSGLLEYVETPVDTSEIGGLRRLKRWLQERAPAMTEPGQNFGLVPARGVLMLGVQGAGKSLCAKAIATAWQWPLLRMDVGALYDKYVGESERRLREALQQADSMAPLVLWIDEIEKAFASAASRSTDGGLSQRMFATLLTWMQERTEPAFLVATANDIEALPPELLRKGRFDEIFFVDLPVAEVRREIFAIHLRKRGRDPAQFDLDQLAAAADGFSGAEIEQAVLAALHDAFFAQTELTTAHVLKAVHDSPPLSVTMAEQVAELRAWAKGRCVPAD